MASSDVSTNFLITMLQLFASLIVLSFILEGTEVLREVGSKCVMPLVCLLLSGHDFLDCLMMIALISRLTLSSYNHAFYFGKIAKSIQGAHLCCLLTTRSFWLLLNPRELFAI